MIFHKNSFMWISLMLQNTKPVWVCWVELLVDWRSVFLVSGIFCGCGPNQKYIKTQNTRARHGGTGL